MPPTEQFSRMVLRIDGGFLALAGGAALVIETVGHFFGVGPFAANRGSPHTIGGFEAHGLALIFAVLLFRAAAAPERRLWHRTGLAIHTLLGGANILFWPFFAAMNAVPMGFVTTILHAVLVGLHLFCLSRAGAGVRAA